MSLRLMFEVFEPDLVVRWEGVRGIANKSAKEVENLSKVLPKHTEVMRFDLRTEILLSPRESKRAKSAVN